MDPPSPASPNLPASRRVRVKAPVKVRLGTNKERVSGAVHIRGFRARPGAVSMRRPGAAPPGPFPGPPFPFPLFGAGAPPTTYPTRVPLNAR